MERFAEPGSPDARMAWENLHARLQEEDLVPDQEAVARNRFRHDFIRIAALVVILLGISAVVYVMTSRRASVEMVQVNTGGAINTLIKTLSDGSVIYIAQNSLFSFPKVFEPGSRNVELQGEAFFDIAPDPAKPFIIEIDAALIKVMGTAFNVKTQDGKGFELSVDRGQVKVTLKNDPSHSVLVSAGEKITVAGSSLVKSKFRDEKTSWYKKRMQFKDETLQNIIIVLNRNFSTNFVLADNETGKHKLTVTFQDETAETMTELICVALNLKSQIINGSVVLSENKQGAERN